MNGIEHTKREERMHRRAMKVQRDRLNKAAPDLLKALKLCQVRIFMVIGSENVEYMTATAAIAKAEGRA